MGPGARVAETRAVAERLTVDNARWEAVKEIFAGALEREPHERGAWLEQACAGDEALRAEVESLLAAHIEDDDFIEKPAARQALKLEDTPPPSWIGRRFGVYRLVEEIGRGGMSEVFKAVRDDDEFHKEVAVKILRRGYDTESLLRRFKVETQILATLDHPNIARLLDAGTTPEGLPYLVMDYIEGLPIDTYCSQHRLGVNARLELFRQLCNAVQYVHRHLMVHGDIKAGNVLVTDQGTVKLLDFGIARLLNPSPNWQHVADTRLTGFLALTPEYASPEQIQGKPITTSSDVYSLGVLLYRLLTGVLPFRSRDGLSFDLAKQICESPPTTPNVAAELNENGETRGFWRRLQGDLDNILLMALEKEPSRRYGSVEAFHEDIRRHLEGFPVTARSAGFVYQAVKFVGRHKAIIAAAAALVLSLVGGIVATTMAARTAIAERARAERHFNEVRKLANTFMFDIHNAIENLPGSTPARQMLVINALQYLDALSQESGNNPPLMIELAAAYEKVGDLQGGFRQANLGDVPGAITSYNKALEIRKAYVKAHPLDRDVRRELLRNYGKLGDVLSYGDLSGAIEASRQALAIAEQLVASPGATAEDRRNLGNVLLALGRQMADANQTERGIMLMHRGMAEYETLLDANPDDQITKRNLAVAYSYLGSELLESTTRYIEALQMQQRSLDIAQELLAGDERNWRLRKVEGYALLNVGTALAKLGKLQPAIDKQLQAVSKLRHMLEADPQNEEARYDAAHALSETGGTFELMGDARAAERYWYEAVQVIGASSLLAEPELTNAKVLLAMTYFRLGRSSVARALDPSTGQSERMKYCEEARVRFERSEPVLAAAESHAGFQAIVGGRIHQIPDELRRCAGPQTRTAVAQPRPM
jgi:serine/threonine protein kinase/tetratricopeptide (TPR) repeat protein